MASMSLTRTSGLIGATVAALLFVVVVQQVNVEQRRATLFVRCGAEGCADDVMPGTSFSAQMSNDEESGTVEASEPAPPTQIQTQFKDIKDPSAAKLMSLGVNVAGDVETYKAIPMASYDPSEYDLQRRNNPGTYYQVRAVRVRSRMGKLKLERMGVVVNSGFKRNLQEIPQHDGMPEFQDASKPCSRIYMSALGGIESEPYLGSIGQMEASSRQILERAGVRVGSNEHVRGQINGPCLMN